MLSRSSFGSELHLPYLRLGGFRRGCWFGGGNQKKPPTEPASPLPTLFLLLVFSTVSLPVSFLLFTLSWAAEWAGISAMRDYLIILGRGREKWRYAFIARYFRERTVD